MLNQTKSVHGTSEKFKGISDSVEQTLSIVTDLNKTSTVMEKQKNFHDRNHGGLISYRRRKCSLY